MRADSGRSDDALAAELLERSRNSGIRLDRAGRFWHEGGEITHAGMRRALLRWIDRLDDGRPVLRLDPQRYVYLEIEDTPLLVVAARWEQERAFISTNDGHEQELDYATLSVGAHDALYCRVRGGRLEARVTTPAFQVLATRIAEQPDGSFALRAAGRAFAIGQR